MKIGDVSRAANLVETRKSLHAELSALKAGSYLTVQCGGYMREGNAVVRAAIRLDVERAIDRNGEELKAIGVDVLEYDGGTISVNVSTIQTAAFDALSMPRPPRK